MVGRMNPRRQRNVLLYARLTDHGTCSTGNEAVGTSQILDETSPSSTTGLVPQAKMLLITQRSAARHHNHWPRT